MELGYLERPNCYSRFETVVTAGVFGFLDPVVMIGASGFVDTDGTVRYGPSEFLKVELN